MENKQIYDVYTIIESQKKTRWTRIGTGFQNKDDSINVILDAYPVNGRLQIRLHEDKEKSE